MLLLFYLLLKFQHFLITDRCKKILVSERKKLNEKSFITFSKKIYGHSQYLKKKLIEFKNNGLNIIVYGAPARVSTITNFSKIDSSLIKYIIDDSPLKQNRFSPGMHIKIVPRKKNISKKIDIVIVFAYEYFNDIKKYFKNKDVKFYKPVPFKKL